MRIEGKVEKYLVDKGFGFIRARGREKNVFFHIRQVRGDSACLVCGVDVEFNIGRDRFGREEARNVRILGAPGKPRSPYFLPRDTLDIIDMKSVDNFSLKLNRLARFFYDNEGGGTFVFFKVATKQGQPDWVNPDFSKVDIEALNRRRKNTISALNLKTKELRFTPDWRLTVGLGQASVYETSMTLHHIYGTPYIPASSIKGVLRNWIITRIFDGLEGNKTTGALADRGFCHIFGSPAQSILSNYRGAIRFFDAFPVTKPKVVPDIMNPHFGPYYTGGNNLNPPADYYSPVPVFFLAVENTTFTTTFGLATGDNAPISSGVFEGKKPLDVVSYWLNDCLAEHGVGAKTAIGYGVSTKTE